MTDPSDIWLWTWRRFEQEPGAEASPWRAFWVGFALVALIVVPIVLVKLHYDRAFFAWIAELF